MSLPLEKEAMSLRFIISSVLSVPKAIEAAGARQTAYSRQEMIEILRQINSKLDRPALASDFDKLFRLGKAPSHRAIEREFDGMAKVRRAGGINNSYKKDSGAMIYRLKYTPEELVGQLKKLGEKLGRKPTG